MNVATGFVFLFMSMNQSTTGARASWRRGRHMTESHQVNEMGGMTLPSCAQPCPIIGYRRKCSEHRTKVSWHEIQEIGAL